MGNKSDASFQSEISTVKRHQSFSCLASIRDGDRLFTIYDGGAQCTFPSQCDDSTFIWCNVKGRNHNGRIRNAKLKILLDLHKSVWLLVLRNDFDDTPLTRAFSIRLFLVSAKTAREPNNTRIRARRMLESRTMPEEMIIDNNSWFF